RLDAFCENIRKCGFDVINNSNYEIIITGNKEKPKTVPIIKTYEDHRIAMAFAPLSATLGEIIIDKPEVVLKSYPSFWNDLQGIGYEISYV
ncbi:MAG TPA: 3-phosphoshikimate 1-carboxyvinyltransferase, partial [Bacteroidales bacterium]|nr:3-phosphoshikimate 1-carboxyvinyltransferase [Bacteroidales bacterium]